MRSLFILFTCCFSLGIIVDFLSIYQLYILALPLGGLSLYQNKKGLFVVSLSFVVLGSLSYHQNNQIPKVKEDIAALQKSGLAHVEILEKRKTSANKNTAYKVNIQSLHVDNVIKSTKGYALLYIADTIEVNPQDRLRVMVRWDTVSPPVHRHAFDYKSYLANQKICLIGRATSVEILSQRSSSWLAWSNRLQVEISKKLEYNFGKNDEIAIVKALLIGDKTGLDHDLRFKYSQVGLVHLLAISGLHVGLIFMIIYSALFLLKLLPAGQYIRWVAALLMLWFYASLTGLSPSVCRASLMISLYLIAKMLNRPQPVMHIIWLSACVLLLIDPNFLFNVGFQLSYVAVLGIVYLYPIFKKRYRFSWVNYLYTLVVVSLIAQLSVLPLSLYYFHTFPSLFLVTNIVLVPLIGFIIGYGLLVLLGIIAGMQWDLLYNPFLLLIKGMNIFVEKLYGVDLSIKDVYLNFPSVILLYSCMIFGGIFLHRRNHKNLYLAFGCYLCFIGVDGYDRYTKHKKVEHLVFDKKSSVIGIRKGGDLSVYSPEVVNKSIAQYAIKPYCVNERIREVTYERIEN